jgi:GTP-binding protein HflX
VALSQGGHHALCEPFPPSWRSDDSAALRAKHPDAILLSAKSPEDVAALRKTIITFFEAAMVDDQIVLPYAKQGLLGDV